MAPLDNSFGAMQVGLLIAAVLEGVLVLQTYVYFNNFSGDPFPIRVLVGVVFVLDLLHLMSASAMQYLYVITHFGDAPYLLKANWGFDVSVLFTSLLAFVIQMFFVWRTWTLTKSHIIAISIAIFSFLSLGTGIACFVLTLILVEFAKFGAYNWLVSLWLGASAACDVLVAISLCYTLWNSRTGFSGTDTVLNRLILWTLNTGFLTSVIAISDTIAFSTRSDLVHFAFNMCLGKLYANMFVATLNQRLSSRSNTTTHHSNNPTSGLEWRGGEPPSSTKPAGGFVNRILKRQSAGGNNQFTGLTSNGNNKVDVRITTSRVHHQDPIQDGVQMKPINARMRRDKSTTGSNSDEDDRKVDYSTAYYGSESRTPTKEELV